MRRISIWSIVVELILCLTVLSGCHAEEIVSTASPDSSRPLYFSEVYRLGYNPAYTICDVTVNRVFDNIYDAGYYDEEFLVVDCTVEHIFFRAPSTIKNPKWVDANAPVLLWIDIKELDESVPELLRSLFEDVDSMIVYGREIETRMVKETPEGLAFIEEMGEQEIHYITDDMGDNILDIPSNIEIVELGMWPLLPIIDGYFDADPVVEIVSKTNDAEMVFNMDLEPTVGSRYFKNGDSKEIVYAALERYVREAKEENIP